MVLDYADPKRGAILLAKVAVAGIAAYIIGSAALGSGAGLVTSLFLFFLTYFVIAYAMK